MPIGFFSGLLALAIIVTLGAAIYLLFNARAIAALFNTPRNALSPGPAPGPVPRNRLVLAIALFVAGTGLCLLLWSFATTDIAADAVESRPQEVQRP